MTEEEAMKKVGGMLIQLWDQQIQIEKLNAQIKEDHEKRTDKSKGTIDGGVRDETKKQGQA